jgi:translocation and assembly module TamA
MRRSHWPARSVRAHGMALLLALFAMVVPLPPAWAQALQYPVQNKPDQPAPPSPAAFALEVRSSDPDISAYLTRHLDLQRYRELDDLDQAELTRLLRDADVQARELLATLGFFKPVLAWSQDKTSLMGTLGQVLLDVQSGPAARIVEVQWQWLGDAADNPQATSQKQMIEQQWALPTGEPFSQSAWQEAKNQALRLLLAERYPWGRILHSLALVDEPSNQVKLWLTLDSGPAVRLGALQISGSDKFGAQQVERLARLPAGQVYRQNDLLEAQQRLVISGFYDSVFVGLLPGDTPDAAPVSIELKESLRQKWVLGLGVRSESGARLSAEHTHHSVPGLNWRSVSKVAIDRDLKSASIDLLAPPDPSLWRWNTSSQIEQERVGGAWLYSQRWRAGRTQLGERIDRSYFGQYDAARLGDDSDQLKSISANLAWTWRNFDNLPFPNLGLGVGIELGSGLTLGSQNEPYVRWRAKGLGLLPLGQTNGRLSLRAEAGSVVSRDTRNLPATQLFLAGGDNSVRGYAPNSIGVDAGHGLTVAGRYMAAGSIEWQRPIRWNGHRTDWESAVFVDAGAVADDSHQLQAQMGYGIGARWRSPVGPVRIDLAYAQALHKLRLHLSVGFNF